MSRLTGGYSIGRPTRACAASGRALEVGQAYIAALIESGGPAPTRADYSLAGWEAARPPARDLIAFWRSHVPEPGHKAKALLSDNALQDLFDASAHGAPDAPAEGGPSRAAVRYVLAVMLVRRRLLVQEGTGVAGALRLRRRGDERPPAGPALVEVPDPGLDEAMLTEVLTTLEAEA